jgi:DNA-binding MarR family transcriptional regulator
MDRLRNLPFVLKDVSRLYTKRFEERANHLSLTLPQCKALVQLSKNEGISQKRLSELSDIEPMTLVRILDRMEADGTIERRPDPTDRRARSLYLTPKANPVLDQIWQMGAQTRSEALEGLTAEERNALLDLLERVQTNLAGLKPIEASAKPATPVKRKTATNK